MAKQAKVRKPHPVLHGIGLVLSAILLVAAMVGTYFLSTMSTIIDSFIGAPSGHYTETEIADTKAKAEALSADVEAEGTVLLQNNDNTLPLNADTKKVNVFGWASTAWLGGGSGSGGVSTVNTDLLAALTAYGIEYNTELTDMYKDFQTGREYTRTLNSWPEQSGRLYEPDINNQTYYTQAMLDNAKNYSDTAIVVIGRLAGESNDATKQQYKRTEKGGDIVVDDTRTMLELTTEEENLLTYVGANYKNVVVLVNSTNVMELGQIETIPGVDACLLVGLSGSEGATAVPEVLWGDKEPSGRTADTWAYDLTTAASYANAGMEGVGAYTDADGLYPADGTTTGNLDTPYAYEQVSYVDYAEGIYIGYKWYETADTEGYWDNVSNEYGIGYNGVVQYPFGYGLSYTSFDWKVTDASANGSTLTKDGSVTVKVTVTNTGDRAGKDVVQLYYTAPYTAGEIEKSSVELGAFAKTKELAPGESEEVTLTVPVSDMASYDAYDANHNGFTGYELDAGDYIFTVRHDAHNVDDDANATITCSLPAGVQYAEDTVTGKPVSNKFTGSDAIDGVSLDGSDSEQNIAYMTRADFASTFPKANTPSRAMTDNVKALNLYTADMADGYINEADEAITTGAKNGLKIEDNGKTTELGYQLGADFNDPQQDSFQAAQQVQTLLLALQIIVGAAAHAFGAECDPLQQNLAHAQHAGLAADQHIEVAGKTVFQRGCLEQTRHQLVRVLAALEVDGQLQAVQVGFITHIADLTDLAQFDQLGDLIHDGFHRCGRRNAGDVNAVVLFIVSPLGAHADAAAAFFQHILHLGGIIQDGTAADKIRRGHQLGQVRLVVFHQGDGCIAELHQVEGTDVGRHTDRNAQCVVGQNGREGDRQHRRFGGGAVIVGHKIHGILVDIAEQLFTHGFQLCLGVTSGGVSHIAAVRLAKVTLGVHKGHQQAFVGTAHTHHGVVDGGITVGVQVHGAAHDVGAFGAGAFQQAHAVHGIQQFAVGGLEAVNFRQRAGNNNAHGVRHVVCFQRIGNGAFDDLTGREDLDVIAQLRAGRGGFLFGCFFCHFALSSPD